MKDDSAGCGAVIFLLFLILLMFGPTLVKEGAKLKNHSIEGTIESVKAEDKNLIVNFEDGRTMTFANMSPKPLLVKKYYKIEYRINDKGNEIFEVLNMEK